MLGAETRKETLRSSCAEVRQKAVSPSAGTESSSASQAEIDKASGIGPRARLDSSSGVIGQFRYPSIDSEEAKPRLLESGKMENCLRESRQEVGKPEANENPDSSGKIEKCSVPLSRLKMMFERGDATQIKVRNGQLQLYLALAGGGGGIALEGQHSELTTMYVVLSMFSIVKCVSWRMLLMYAQREMDVCFTVQFPSMQLTLLEQKIELISISGWCVGSS